MSSSLSNNKISDNISGPCYFLLYIGQVVLNNGASCLTLWGKLSGSEF